MIPIVNDNDVEDEEQFVISITVDGDGGIHTLGELDKATVVINSEDQPQTSTVLKIVNVCSLKQQSCSVSFV